jgi:ATP-dependent DNA helicase RecG
MSETNRIEYKQKLNESLEKEVIAFLNYRDSGQVGDKDGGQVGGTIGGAMDGAIDEIIVELTDRQKEVLKIISDNSKVSIRTIAGKLGINDSAAQKHVDKLKEKGVIERVGGTRGYWIIKTKNQ